MKKNLRKLAFITMAIMLISILAIGCAPEEEPTPPPENGEETDIDEDETDIDEDVDEDNVGARADDIADAVVDIDRVNDATVVISGDTALVGVDVEDEVEGALSEDIRQEIEDVVKSEDETIDRVVVTGEPDLFERIDRVTQDIRQGSPLTDLNDEIEDILGTIEPGES